jgi:hypothetical protein
MNTYFEGSRLKRGWDRRLGLMLFLIGLVFACNDPSAQAELLPTQVMIVANVNSRESLMVAKHYATRRGVPLQQIAQLDLPLD